MSFDKQIVQECVTTFMTSFSKQYSKGFAVAIVKDSLNPETKQAGPDRQLSKFKPTAPQLASEVQFSPDGGGKMKAQYWRINEKYNIEVWANQKDAEAVVIHTDKSNPNAKQPKNVICPWDYSAWYWQPPSTDFPRRRGGPTWESGETKDICEDCNQKFSQINRRKHCRTCGLVKCWNCTKKEWPLYTLGYNSPQGVCNPCYKRLEESGLDSFKFPEEKKAKVYGIRMYHGYRKPLFFTVASEELQQKWLNALYSCCRYAEAPRNPSKYQAAAFEAAHRYVWWNQGPWWRWWRVFGTEQEMLIELLTFVVNRRCLNQILAGLKVPGPFRSKAEKAVESTIEKMVTAGVESTWPAAVKGVSKLEATIVPKIKEQLDPIGQARTAVIAKLTETISTPIGDAISKVGQPLLDKVLPVMFRPLTASFVGAARLLRDTYTEMKESLPAGPLSAKDFKHKCDHYYFWWRVRDKITDVELEPMMKAFELLGRVPPLNYLNAWGIKYAISSAIEEILENAFYTVATDNEVQKQLEANTDAKAVAEAAWPPLYAKFCYDSVQIVRETCRSILLDMLSMPILKTVNEAPGVSDALDAAQGLIPAPLQDFFNIPDIVQEILAGALVQIVDRVCEENMRAGMEMLQQGQQAVKDLA